MNLYQPGPRPVLEQRAIHALEKGEYGPSMAAIAQESRLWDARSAHRIVSRLETEDTAALFGPPKTTEPLPMEFLYYPYIPYFGVTLFAGIPAWENRFWSPS